MARLVYIRVNKDRKLYNKLKNKALSFLNEIQPKDIIPNKEIVLENENSVTILVNPTRAHKINGNNAMIGLCYEDIENKWQEFGNIPDGNFVIKRENNHTVEILTDYQATKSLWYYYDNKMLIVSSSQRMIIHLLGSFELNEQAVMWMLSSGTLGYKNSWDKRIQSIPAATIIKLDKNIWKLKTDKSPIEFKSNKKSLKENIKLFDEKLNKIFSNINLKKINPLLSITGGYDSRTVLMYLYKYNKNIDLMTFGDKDSLETQYSDLFVSKAIAEKYKLNWRLYDTHPQFDNIDKFFTSFLKLGEGRLDLIERNSDNFQWLVECSKKNNDILLNGMEGFSSQYPFNDVTLNLQLRKLFLLERFSNINLQISFNQEYHEDFLKENLNFNQHYYKINQIFFNPYGDAALNEIQNCYIDVINPLLSKSIIEFIRQLPDKQRVGKKIAKELVHKKDNTNVPFSDRVSVLNTKNILKQKNINEYINSYLEDNNDIFETNDINNIINKTNSGLKQEIKYNLKTNKSNGLKKQIIKKFPSLVHKLIEFKKMHQKLELNPFLLKYRMFLTEKMVKQLKQDAKN